MHVRKIVTALVLGFATTASFALDADERALFGLTALEQSHPHLTGEGYSVGVADTEFDVTHPGLGWTGGPDYNFWYHNRQYIPQLNRVNPRIFMAGHRMSTDTVTTNYHGVSSHLFALPITYNNTLMTNWWPFHGTAVAGTAAGGLPGPQGHSLGAAHKARLVLAGDSADLKHVLSMVPDGNPSRTVTMNRSFTGSTFMDPAMRRNSGVIGVNAAGNYFTSIGPKRMEVFGISPHGASVRWMEQLGYDLIASGLSVINSNNAHPSAFGSMRNQESIFTDYSVRTISPGGFFDTFASGTSFASPFLAGGVTLVQQAYETVNPGRWLTLAQMSRVLMRSAKFTDDPFTGLRYHVADFAAAVALAESYVGDPGFEPNFSTTFGLEPRINTTITATNHYRLNPNYFRVSTFYGTNHYMEYTAPRVDGSSVRVRGIEGGGEVNVALRNGWGDLARVDLTETGKQVSVAFNFDMFPGSTAGARTEFFVGIKEMYGSLQFMDDFLDHDNIDRGRLAFRITYNRNDASARIDLLQCSQAPVINQFESIQVWRRPNHWGAPVWDATPLATAYVNNLHNGTMPRIEVSFNRSRAVFKLNNQTLIDAAHTAPQISLTRATPYMHFRNNRVDSEQRLSAFSATTTSGNIPMVTLQNIRQRALEGVSGPAAHGIIRVSRTTSINQPLTVYYTLGGNAINGVDYEMLWGTVTIPANTASADVLIKPINDYQIEGLENATVGLIPHATYSISPHTEFGSVIIADYSDIDGDGIWSWDEDTNGNGDLSDDDANANMLPNYLDYHDRSPTNNLPPVANAGPSRSTVGINHVFLDGTGSHDPDGSIVTILWSIVPEVSNGPVVLEDANSITPKVYWTAPTTNARTVQVRLTVIDNHGASASATTTVTQLAGGIFNKTYPQVFFRGTPNAWGTTVMSLVTNYIWQTELFIGSGANSFKFDVYGDWSLNFGDNNNDGIADQSGANIAITQGSGNYRIRFNDQTRVYTVTKVVPNVPPFAIVDQTLTTYQMNPVALDGSGSYDSDGHIVSYNWTIIDGQSGPVTITNTSSPVATMHWHAPTLSTRVARVRFTVTDNEGASSSSTVTVTQTSTLVYNKTYPQVYFRGTPNGWGTSDMTLVSNYTWLIELNVGTGAQSFKFDVYGDWTLNFGDNNADGIAEQSGANIGLTQGAGTYRIWFNDQTRRYNISKLAVNQPPVANAGPNQTFNSLNGATVSLNGNGSYDPDGTIIEYSWYQSSGPYAIISYAHPGNPAATVVLLSQTTTATYVFSLKVTDNEGASATGHVTIVQQAGGFNKVYPQVYFRGTPNNWGTTIMNLVSNNLWETEATFGAGSNERFKFDIYGDWSLNFGDNNNDGVADQSGGNIMITSGAGTYRIRFNDLTRVYSAVKVGGTFNRDYTTMSVAGTFNTWNPAANNMTLIGDHTWSGTFVLSGNVQFKFAANGGWGTNWGDNDQPGTSVPLNGTLENSGANINLNNLAGATYRITMHERTRVYSVTLVAGSEAGLNRLLVGWEARYGIDLFANGAADHDPDGDGLSNLAEYHLGTDPYEKDTDKDGMTDLEEVIAGTDPLNLYCVLEVRPEFVDGQLGLTWLTRPNRLYRLEGSVGMEDSSDWIALTGWLSHDGSGIMFAPPVDGYIFFRVLTGDPSVIKTSDLTE
ncbi:MAG TPA: S8 family serine peptidase [Kiritimatiellia bacterium]|nr:S8 family serine peptidase [Kiritimatiellia bacterium]